ncbi:MAG: MFS transporter [archaeon]
MNRLGLVILISSLAFSFMGTVWAVYLNSFLSNEAYVGLISSLFVAISFISYFVIIPLIERTNKSKLYIASSLLIALGYFMYSINNFYIFLAAAITVTIATTLRISSMGLIIEHCSKKENLSKNEGYIYTLTNVAWVIGPLLVGFILKEIGIRWVFIFSSFLIILSIMIFNIAKINCKIKKKRIDGDMLKNFKDFFKSKNRRKAYLLGAGVNFWWSLIYIYFPLLIIKHLHEDYVGYLLFAVVVPLVLSQYYFGKLAGKIGFRKMFFVGFLIPTIAAIICFIFFNNFIVVAIALILASIGLAMTESTTEAYFFDICKKEESQRFYPPYNTAIDAGYLAGELLPALMLLFLPIKFIFLLYAAGLLCLTLVSLTIKDIIENHK